MTTTDMPLSPRAGRSGFKDWLTRSEAWLDARGKPAWIAAMVLGFIAFWPLGLAILAYMIWSKRMFAKSCRSHRARVSPFTAMRSSGNTAFDAYKAEFDQFMDDRAAKAREAKRAESDDDTDKDAA